MYWKDKGGDQFEQPPIGTHVARCIALIDLGTRTGIYGDKRDVLIRWELPLEQTANGDVHIASAFYTQSLNEKANLRIMLKSWRGRDFTEKELDGFDAKTIIGVPCMIGIIEKVKADKSVKHVVSSVSAVAKGMQVPAQITPSLFFSLDDYDPRAFEALGEGIQKMVKESTEYKALGPIAKMGAPSEEHHVDYADDDVPF
jgi:hypothetical protein